MGLKIESQGTFGNFNKPVQDCLQCHLQAKSGIVVYDPYQKFRVTTSRYEPMERPFCVAYPSAIPKDFFINGLGLICHYELKFEAKTSIPLRLRLGSLEYVNYLEQKPNSRW